MKLAIDEDPIVIRLASSLGYFKQEGIEIVPVKVESFEAEDYLMQNPLIKGQIDASYHWFNHTLFGARPLALAFYLPPDRFDIRIELNFDVQSHQALLFPLRRLTGDLSAFAIDADGAATRRVEPSQHLGR